jgi:hypothetical protein
MLRQQSAGLETIIGRIDDLQQAIFGALDQIDGACQGASAAFRDWQITAPMAGQGDRSAA